MRTIKNKSGGEKLLSIWWMFVLALIAGALVLAVFIYYSAEINVNSQEAEILGERIAMCISDNGYLNGNIGNIFENCHINKSLFENGTAFYFKIEVLDNENGNERIVKEISFGDASFAGDCMIQKEVFAKYYPKCFIKEMSLIQNNKNLKINILSASNQKGVRF